MPETLDPVAHFRRLFEHETVAHAALLGAFASVPDAHFGSERMQGALDLLGHVAACRHLWLHRLGELEEGPDDLFPLELDATDLGERLRAIEADWVEWFETLEPEELARSFRYKDLAGVEYESTVADVLTQMTCHSAYHRGQVARVVRELGGKPATTDYIFWARTKVEVEEAVDEIEDEDEDEDAEAVE